MILLLIPFIDTTLGLGPHKWTQGGDPTWYHAGIVAFIHMVCLLNFHHSCETWSSGYGKSSIGFCFICIWRLWFGARFLIGVWLILVYQLALFISRFSQSFGRKYCEFILISTVLGYSRN
jgi:hypothetical protein